MRKFVKCRAYCTNCQCGFCQKKQPNISYGQKCEDYTPSFAAYVQAFYEAMGDSNMLLPQDTTPMVQIGAYYAMKIFGLTMVECNRGNWKWFMFVKEGGDKKDSLTVDEIIKLPINNEVMNDLVAKFKEGKLPPFEDEKKVMEEEKKADDDLYAPYAGKEPLGWGMLSPAGAFYEAEFGTHEGQCLDMMKKLGLKWMTELNRTGMKSAVDYMVYIKNYVLIHNPFGQGTPIVTKGDKPLTISQRNFLYDYFMLRRDKETAYKYLKEEE